MSNYFPSPSAFCKHCLLLMLLMGSVSEKVRAGNIQPDTLEDIVNIDFRLDVRLFTVMAALNAAGFNLEREGFEMSPVRVAVRNELSDLDPDLQARLGSFYRSRSPSQSQSIQSAYTSLALLISGPPDFSFQGDVAEIPGEVLQVSEFSELLPEFYKKANIEQLWKKYQSAYVQELEKYRPVAKEVIRNTLDYFRIPARVVLDRQIILMPDLLSFQNVVNARNLEKTYYIVVGSTETASSNYYQLQHEYLHFLIDPLIQKYGGQLMRFRTLLPLADDQPKITEEFRGHFLLIVGESLIEALLARFQPPEDREAHEARLFRQGFIFAPAFIRALDEFDQTPDVRLPLFLEKVFNSLSTKMVEDDQKRVYQIRKRQIRERSAAEEARKRELDEQKRVQAFQDQFKAAGLLINQNELDKAETILQSLLQEEPENGDILFYLAQIESQRKNYPKSLDYYLRVTESKQVKEWVRARAFLSAGRIFASQRKYSQAREMFDAVFKLEGDLKGALEEAKELIGYLPE